MYKPHLLKEVRDPATDEVIQTVEPELLHSTNFEPALWKELQDDLRWTVTNGSAKHSLFNKVVKIAAKTGTAEVTGYKDSWHSWLLAYAPYDGPIEDRIVVATIVEAANKYSWWAPYATNITMQGIFAHQTYEDAVAALGWQYLVKQTDQASSDSRE